MTKTFSIEKRYGISANNCKAEGMHSHFTTFSPVVISERLERVRTTFRRPGKGLCSRGILSQVFLPIITAFVFSGSVVVFVISLKNLRSEGNLHCNLPSFPIPISRVAATTTW